MHAVRQAEVQLAGDLGFGVMIAANHEHPDSGLGQALHLADKEQRGFHAFKITVVKIAGNQQGVYPLGKAQLHGIGERLPGGPANQTGNRRIPQRQRPQRRIQMNVGGVDEAERGCGHTRSAVWEGASAVTSTWKCSDTAIINPL